MRAVVPALSALLVPSLANAVDVELGADADVGFAYGTTLKGPGGGAAVRLGIGPNPLKLGPSALSLMGEARAAYWVFPDATDGPTNLMRGTVGARGIFTALWIRKPEGEGGRGRGIRLDVPIAVHGGMGSLDDGSTWTPTGDASLGLAVGLLPVQLGIHIGAGGLLAGQAIEADGTAWINAGVDVGAVF